MTSSLAIVFIVYNQTKLLNSSLKLLSGLKHELHVADLGSTEDVESVAKALGAEYHRLPYTSVVETVRSQVFDLISTDYILYLDGDESVTPTLINKLVELSESGVDYVRIPRQNYIFNNWVQASRWWPDYQVRFFKRGMVTFPTTLHSEPVVTGREVVLPATAELAIKHLNYQSLDEWLEKNQRYARTDAQDRLASGVEFSIFTASRLSVSELVSRFFAGSGYADGMHGLVLSILQSFYYFLVYAYYWEGKKYESSLSVGEVKSVPRIWFSHGLSEILFWDKQDTGLINKIKGKLKRKLLA